MIIPQTRDQLFEAVHIARQKSVACFIIGNGTNILAADAGYRGVIIKTDSLSKITVSDDTLNIEAGASLARVATAAMNAGLAGMEFASGIPGSFGGAVCMNAGAYGGEIKDVLVNVKILNPSGIMHTLSTTQAELSYRNSRISREGFIVLSGTISLEPGDSKQIHERSAKLNSMRREKQPLDYPSAGSTFKRPPGKFAGKLIMDAGLAGFSIGGAMVSLKHCGFIVNTGGATCVDVTSLISHVQDTVNDKFGVELEPEIKFL
jgi:UDP-N-acetylmuramate dehydrogenase